MACFHTWDPIHASIDCDDFPYMTSFQPAVPYARKSSMTCAEWHVPRCENCKNQHNMGEIIKALCTAEFGHVGLNIDNYPACAIEQREWIHQQHLATEHLSSRHFKASLQITLAIATLCARCMGWMEGCCQRVQFTRKRIPVQSEFANAVVVLRRGFALQTNGKSVNKLFASS